MDRHWENAMIRNCLERIIQLKKKHDGVKLFVQDNTAKGPCGGKVPFSAKVRANNKVITFENYDEGVKVIEHDFYYSNIVPSVTLRCHVLAQIGELLLLEVLKGMVRHL